MRFRNPSILAASCLLFTHTAPADIIILKNGERMEGTVLREVDGKYVVEVKVTNSIRDEKIIPRDEVARIEKEPEDEKAFRKIAELFPVPELCGVEEYQKRIELFEAFLKDYPASGRVAKVKGMIDSLGGELNVVSTGGFKLDDVLVTGDEHAANAYEFDARIAEKKIKDAVARRDFLPALRMFDQYEVSFGESEGYAGLSALMLRVLGAYGASVTESLASLDGRLKEREEGLKRMALEDRSASVRAIQQETDSLKKRFADEKAAKVKWVTPDAFLKESMEETLRQITAETSRLEGAPKAPATPLAQLYRDSWEKLSGGTDEQKKALLEEAKAKRLPENYLAKLRERAALSGE